jgi:hypothetical protein
MYRTKFFFGTVALVISLAASAQAPFEFGGLHTDLEFSDAIAKAQQLGGACKVKTSSNSSGGVSANCELLPCTFGTEVGVCQEQHSLPTKLSIGAQPIINIGLDAPSKSSTLRRITFLFEGSVDAMAAFLVKQFGAPTNDGTVNGQDSWSHSQRRTWRNGNYNLGLMNSPNLVILSATPPASSPVEH